MTVIECPHCAGEVQLEPGASGIFECPHCAKDFEFGQKANSSPDNYYTKFGLNSSSKVGLVLLFTSFLAIIFGIMYLNSGLSEIEESEVDCEASSGGDKGDSVPGNPFSLEFWGIGDCGSSGDFGMGSFCCSIICILVGIGVGISSLISLIAGAASGNQKVIIVQNEKR